jgi:hypothetical protein
MNRSGPALEADATQRQLALNVVTRMGHLNFPIITIPLQRLLASVCDDYQSLYQREHPALVALARYLATTPLREPPDEDIDASMSLDHQHQPQPPNHQHNNKQPHHHVSPPQPASAAIVANGRNKFGFAKGVTTAPVAVAAARPKQSTSVSEARHVQATLIAAASAIVHNTDIAASGGSSISVDGGPSSTTPTPSTSPPLPEAGQPMLRERRTKSSKKQSPPTTEAIPATVSEPELDVSLSVEDFSALQAVQAAQRKLKKQQREAERQQQQKKLPAKKSSKKGSSSSSSTKGSRTAAAASAPTPATVPATDGVSIRDKAQHEIELLKQRRADKAAAKQAAENEAKERQARLYAKLRRQADANRQRVMADAQRRDEDNKRADTIPATVAKPAKLRLPRVGPAAGEDKRTVIAPSSIVDTVTTTGDEKRIATNDHGNAAGQVIPKHYPAAVQSLLTRMYRRPLTKLYRHYAGKSLATGGKPSSFDGMGKAAKSMSLTDFLKLLTDMTLLPRLISKDSATKLFRHVIHKYAAVGDTNTGTTASPSTDFVLDQFMRSLWYLVTYMELNDRLKQLPHLAHLQSVRHAIPKSEAVPPTPSKKEDEDDDEDVPSIPLVEEKRPLDSDVVKMASLLYLLYDGCMANGIGQPSLWCDNKGRRLSDILEGTAPPKESIPSTIPSPSVPPVVAAVVEEAVTPIVVPSSSNLQRAGSARSVTSEGGSNRHMGHGSGNEVYKGRNKAERQLIRRLNKLLAANLHATLPPGYERVGHKQRVTRWDVPTIHTHDEHYEAKTVVLPILETLLVNVVDCHVYTPVTQTTIVYYARPKPATTSTTSTAPQNEQPKHEEQERRMETEAKQRQEKLKKQVELYKQQMIEKAQREKEEADAKAAEEAKSEARKRKRLAKKREEEKLKLAAYNDERQAAEQLRLQKQREEAEAAKRERQANVARYQQRLKAKSSSASANSNENDDTNTDDTTGQEPSKEIIDTNGEVDDLDGDDLSKPVPVLVPPMTDPVMDASSGVSTVNDDNRLDENEVDNDNDDDEPIDNEVVHPTRVPPLPPLPPPPLPHVHLSTPVTSARQPTPAGVAPPPATSTITPRIVPTPRIAMASPAVVKPSTTKETTPRMDGIESQQPQASVIVPSSPIVPSLPLRAPTPSSVPTTNERPPTTRIATGRPPTTTPATVNKINSARGVVTHRGESNDQTKMEERIATPIVSTGRKGASTPLEQEPDHDDDESPPTTPEEKDISARQLQQGTEEEETAAISSRSKVATPLVAPQSSSTRPITTSGVPSIPSIVGIIDTDSARGGMRTPAAATTTTQPTTRATATAEATGRRTVKSQPTSARVTTQVAQPSSVEIVNDEVPPLSPKSDDIDEAAAEVERQLENIREKERRAKLRKPPRNETVINPEGERERWQVTDGNGSLSTNDALTLEALAAAVNEPITTTMMTPSTPTPTVSSAQAHGADHDGNTSARTARSNASIGTPSFPQSRPSSTKPSARAPSRERKISTPTVPVLPAHSLVPRHGTNVGTPTTGQTPNERPSTNIGSQQQQQQQGSTPEATLENQQTHEESKPPLPSSSSSSSSRHGTGTKRTSTTKNTTIEQIVATVETTQSSSRSRPSTTVGNDAPMIPSLPSHLEQLQNNDSKDNNNRLPSSKGSSRASSVLTRAPPNIPSATMAASQPSSSIDDGPIPTQVSSSSSFVDATITTTTNRSATGSSSTRSKRSTSSKSRVASISAGVTHQPLAISAQSIATEINSIDPPLANPDASSIDPTNDIIDAARATTSKSKRSSRASSAASTGGNVPRPYPYK